jgi:hypothetical protein
MTLVGDHLKIKTEELSLSGYLRQEFPFLQVAEPSAV